MYSVLFCCPRQNTTFWFVAQVWRHSIHWSGCRKGSTKNPLDVEAQLCCVSVQYTVFMQLLSRSLLTFPFVCWVSGFPASTLVWRYVPRLLGVSRGMWRNLGGTTAEKAENNDQLTRTSFYCCPPVAAIMGPTPKQITIQTILSPSAIVLFNTDPNHLFIYFFFQDLFIWMYWRHNKWNYFTDSPHVA